MLKPCKNPYDVLNQLPAAFGTIENPRWCLCFNWFTDLWSALDMDSPSDLVEIAMTPNWRPICQVPPDELGITLDHERPDIICENLRAFAVDARPNAAETFLSMFLPILDPQHIIVEEPPS